jgi:UDP-N-acetylmuramate--alanine ligase
MTAAATTSAAELAPGARVHLIGVGGAGMSPLARILLERGHPVSGSDLRGGPAAEVLAALGATVHVGHDAAPVDGAALVVISSAVPASNPEVVAAEAAGVPVILRAQLLELVMHGRRRILVAGTHGKTTTTAMVATILADAGADPGFAIGGVLAGAGISARAGTGQVFVAEADEAYRSFLHLTADCAIVTNLEMDHHDEYADEAAVVEAFLGFADRRTPGAPVIVCADDPGALDLSDRIEGPVVRYGTSEGADVRIGEVTTVAAGSSFTLTRAGVDLGTFALPFTGMHTVRNATAAIVAALWAGVEVEAARAALAGFSGTQRRFQRIGEADGVLVVDDYAHHPTELAAVIAAAREARPDGRVLVAFQPHRWSRTAAFGAAMGRELAAADVALVTDVYAAGEDPVDDAGPPVIVGNAVAAGGSAEHVPSVEALPARVAALARAGDIVLTLGAGDITRQAPAVLAALTARPDGGGSGG